MLITKKHLLTMFAMAGILVAASSVNAASIVNGDLLLGFRVTGGTGSGTDLIVRAGASVSGSGNAVTFRDAAGLPFSVINLNDELSAIYGASWASRSDLSWGVVGVRSTIGGNGSAGNGQTPGRSPFIGIAQSASTEGVQSSSAPDLSANGGLRTNISNEAVTINTNFAATADNGVSAAEAIYLSSGLGGGWTDRQSTSFTLGGGTEVSNAQGIDNTGLDLYWITDRNTGAQDNGVAVTSTIGQGIYQGSFQISSAGIVSFAPVAVPEPSRALLAGLGLAGIAFRRRRSTKKNA